MAYYNEGCGGHLDGVTSTIYAKICVFVHRKMSLIGSVAFDILYVQFLFGNFCFKCILSCNSPEEYTVS